MKKYDLIVIGTGSANIVLDEALNKGLKCAQIEMGKFGGTCLNRGCIPTKILVTAADFIRESEEIGKIGVKTQKAEIDWDVLSKRLWDKLAVSEEIKQEYIEDENLDVYEGRGFFVGDKEVQVELNSGGLSDVMTADKILIAVGGRTNIPRIEGLDDVGYLSSESLFGDKYPKKPYESLIIVGGGPIGVEFGHFFSAAGTKVTIVQHNVRLLPKEDEEISEQILKDIEKLGIDVRLNMKTVSIRMENGKKVLKIKERTTGEEFEVSAEEIMIAPGITPNTDTLRLENTNISVSERGWIKTNEFLETSVDGVYAIGDVNGQPAFRHKANYEADILATNLYFTEKLEDYKFARYNVVPAVTYTYPQVAHVGLTEKQARDKGYDVVVGKNYYSSTAKGYAMGFDPGDENDGFIKIVVDRNTREYLGAHIIGPEASILIQPFINMMNAGEVKLVPINEEIASENTKKLRSEKYSRFLKTNSIDTVTETMAPHPSLSEVTMWAQFYINFDEKND